MFARKVLGFSLACLLAASNAFAFEGIDPYGVTDAAQPAAATETTDAMTPEFGLPADKFVGDEVLATGSEDSAIADADS